MKIRGWEVAEIRHVQGFLAQELTAAGQAFSFQGASRGNHPSILGHTLEDQSLTSEQPLSQIPACALMFKLLNALMYLHYSSLMCIFLR